VFTNLAAIRRRLREPRDSGAIWAIWSTIMARAIATYVTGG